MLRGIHFILAVFFLLGIMTVTAEFRLTKDSDRYTLDADDAPLTEILAELDHRESAALRFYGDDERLVSARFTDVTLDQLLYRLGVSYVLVYERDEQGVSRLGDAMLLDSHEDGLSDETRARVQGWIRDLQSDDVFYNAHQAYYELMQLGCEAVPMLEAALNGDDYQGVHLAASVLRYICKDRPPGDRLVDVTLALLNREGYDNSEYWSLFTPTEAYEYLSSRPELYPRIRSRLIHNLQSRNPQEKLLSALLLAERGERQLTGALVNIMVPHLKDNDMKSDAAAVSFAMYHQLGRDVLPYLTPYRTSSDRQQAELAELICSALESGEVPAFNPEMYAGYVRNPLREKPRVNAARWDDSKFPDTAGTYTNLSEYRPTVNDYYGNSWVSQPFLYVSSGQTFAEIAATFMVPEQLLRDINSDVTEDPIPAGVEIDVPFQ